MELTIQVNPVERTVRFREVHALAAGDSCVVTLDGIRGADVPSLRMALYRDAASESPVASCPSFSPVQGHPNLATGTLRLDTAEMASWFDAVRPESPQEESPSSQVRSRPEDAAERAVRTDGWLVVSDSTRTWTACRVPVILRPGAGTSGVVDPTSLTALVEGLVSAAMSGAMSGKADKVANATDGNLAALDANGNLADSGKKPADFADAAQFDAHRDNGEIHIVAAERSAWDAKYAKPQDGIPKSDLAEAVRTSLGKADTAIQEHQSLAAYVNGGVYDGDAKKILLKHDGATVSEIDATAFIKDGMVSEVKIVGDNLVVVFNADAGKEPVSIPLSRIFNPANFYDKTAADGRFVQKEAGKGLFSGSYADLVDKPTIPAPVFVDPTFTQSGAAADAKAVGDALRDGFTPWTFGGAAVPGVTYTVDITEYEGPTYIASLQGSDGANETAGVDSPDVTEVTFDLYGITATRRRVVPTKTSQLVNDGDGASPFAKVSQLPYPFTTVAPAEAWAFSGDTARFTDLSVFYSDAEQGWYLNYEDGGFPGQSEPAVPGDGTETSITFGHGGETWAITATRSNVLTVSPRTVATYTAGTTAAAFTVAMGAGTAGAARDCVLVIDCTATGAVAPTVTWGAEFAVFEGGSAAGVAPVAGKANLYRITEHAVGHFAVRTMDNALLDGVKATIALKADKATTLAGYGINDAKIQNGVITLGGQSITPLTSVPTATGSQLGVVKPDGTTITIADGVLSAVGGGGGGGGSATGGRHTLSFASNATIGYDHINYIEATPFTILRSNGCETVDVPSLGLGIRGMSWSNVLAILFYNTPGESSVIITGDYVWRPAWADYLVGDGVGVLVPTSDIVVTEYYTSSCLSPDTRVLMADGTERRLDEVREGDIVAGPCGPDRVVAVSTGAGDAMDEWTFADGTVVKTVGRHRFWNRNLGEPMYLEAWNLGEEAENANGSGVRLVGHRRVEGGRFPHATLFTEKFNLYYANGLLAGNRRSRRPS